MLLIPQKFYHVYWRAIDLFVNC